MKRRVISHLVVSSSLFLEQHSYQDKKGVLVKVVAWGRGEVKHFLSNILNTATNVANGNILAAGNR